MKTLLVLAAVAAAAVVSAAPTPGHRRKHHEEPVRVCTITSIHTAFENGQLVEMREEHTPEACPELHHPRYDPGRRRRRRRPSAPGPRSTRRSRMERSRT